MNERLLSKLRQVTLRDIGHLFLFLAALLPSAIFKMRRPDLWLICESANEARDNGYWLFRFLCRERPQVDAVYAICHTSPDYAKVASLGQVVEYGSFRPLGLLSRGQGQSQQPEERKAKCRGLLSAGGRPRRLEEPARVFATRRNHERFAVSLL